MSYSDETTVTIRHGDTIQVGRVEVVDTSDPDRDFTGTTARYALRERSDLDALMEGSCTVEMMETGGYAIDFFTLTDWALVPRRNAYYFFELEVTEPGPIVRTVLVARFRVIADIAY